MARMQGGAMMEPQLATGTAPGDGETLTPEDPAWRTAVADMAEFLAEARRLVVLTGAGASTESGIPDFRGPDGIWTRVSATSYRAFLTDAAARRDYWRLRRELGPTVAAARPNAVHIALAELEWRGILAGILTQNFDGLHQAAGSSPERVIELHGSSREAACQSCGARSPIEPVQARVAAGEEDPRCACGGLLKAATILFGQPLPAAALARAQQLAASCDLFLVVGSSLRVNPAARLPLLALERGVPLLIVNREPTRFDERADVALHAQAGPALRAMVDRIIGEAGR
jgi:NAD-dependent deacetylase